MHQVISLQEAIDTLKTRAYSAVVISLDAFDSDVVRFCRLCKSLHREIPQLVVCKGLTCEQEALFYECGVLDIILNMDIYSNLFAKKLGAYLWTFSEDCLYAPFRLGDAIVDLNKKEVSRDGRTWTLCGRVTALLTYFMGHCDRVVTREELEQSPIWADSALTPASEGGKVIDMYIGKLRKLLQSNPKDKSLLKTIHGVGWRLLERPVICSRPKADRAETSG